MTARFAGLLAFCAVGAVSPLFGADGPAESAPKRPFQVSSSERFEFAPGGEIRLDNSYGYLTVEGWDEPEVEVTTTKSTDGYYSPDEKRKIEKRFAEEVHVVTERPSNRELTISTTLPKRNSLLTSVLPSGRIILTTPVPPNNKRGITVEYTVHVPRASRLVIHHDNGYVWVGDVSGDIEVNSHTGDMIVMLPDPGPFAIDARTRMGGVSSDFSGYGAHQYVFGARFLHSGPAPARRILLRMGRGSITIKSGPASGPIWKD